MEGIIVNTDAKQERIKKSISECVLKAKEIASNGYHNGYFTLPRDERHEILEALWNDYKIYQVSLSKPTFNDREAEYKLGWN